MSERIKVRALWGFDNVRKGEVIEVDARRAEKLQAKGLVELQGNAPAGGGKQSASPAAPASPKKTAAPSKRGGRRRRTEASS